VNELPAEASSSFEIRVLPDPPEAALAAAHEVAHVARDAVANRGIFRIALSGGSTPRLLFDVLTHPPFREGVAWNRARFFFVDERCVPPDHERSNYRMAKKHLFEPLEIPPDRVARMGGEDDPETAARAYEEVLEKDFGRPGPAFRFDFLLLGLGADGHTASLFPGTAALLEDRRAAVANRVPKLGEWRLTLTLPVLNASRHAVFLVIGAEKSEAVEAVTKRRAPDLPGSRVHLDGGSLIWIVDEAAAGGAKSSRRTEIG
jgi:6-phosphogluconolactonase